MSYNSNDALNSARGAELERVAEKATAEIAALLLGKYPNYPEKAAVKAIILSHLSAQVEEEKKLWQLVEDIRTVCAALLPTTQNDAADKERMERHFQRMHERDADVKWIVSDIFDNGESWCVVNSANELIFALLTREQCQSLVSRHNDSIAKTKGMSSQRKEHARPKGGSRRARSAAR